MKSPETYERRMALRVEGEMAGRVARFDWSTTPLGPINQWSTSLRTLVQMMLASRFPMEIFWGREMIVLYNDAFRPSLSEGGKHPGLLGQPGAEGWSDTWAHVGPMVHRVMDTGEGTFFENQSIPITRDGVLDSAYWTYGFSALTDDDGTVGGILVTCLETTQDVEHLEYFSAPVVGPHGY